MVESDTPDKFAFGCDQFKHAKCPAMKHTGEEPTGYMLELAEQYDLYVKELTGNDEGIIDPETAKEAWDMVIEHFEERRGQLQANTERWEILNTKVTMAAEVKRAVFE